MWYWGLGTNSSWGGSGHSCVPSVSVWVCDTVHPTAHPLRFPSFRVLFRNISESTSSFSHFENEKMSFRSQTLSEFARFHPSHHNFCLSLCTLRPRDQLYDPQHAKKQIKLKHRWSPYPQVTIRAWEEKFAFTEPSTWSVFASDTKVLLIIRQLASRYKICALRSPSLGEYVFSLLCMQLAMYLCSMMYAMLYSSTSQLGFLLENNEEKRLTLLGLLFVPRLN